MKRLDGVDRIRPYFWGRYSLTVWLMGGVGAFVLVGTVAMVMYFNYLGRVEEMVALESLGKANALFLDQSNLPQSSHMAGQLGRVMGAEVEFLEEKGLADGKARREGERIRVGYGLASGKEVWFSREVRELGPWAVWKRVDARIALGVFWVMGLVFGVWLGRKVTVPMGRLAAVLPRIGGEGELEGLPDKGPLEIRRLSEVLRETHESLRNERERRRNAERLAILGRMATSLAHEVRNPVSAIRLHGQLLERVCGESEKESVGMIVEEAGRIEGLVNQWMRYAKPGGIKSERVVVRDLLDDVVRGLGAQARHSGVNFRMVVEAEDEVVMGDGERLRQVFWNVLLNAVQSVAVGGEVVVKILQGRVDIEDEGKGFSEEALVRFGEAFHSEREGGMGLGLAVSKEIVEAHGGRMIGENRDGGGARVSVIWK